MRSQSSPGNCTQCNNILTPENWDFVSGSNKEKIKSWCKFCRDIRNNKYRIENLDRYNRLTRQRRKEKKQRTIEYKGGVCEHCQGTFHSAAFDFHHLDPKEKEYEPGTLMGMSDDLLFQELDKCILLCSNCHRVHHFEETWNM